MKSKQPIFKKSILALFFCIIASLFYVQKGDKSKATFQKITGALTAIEKTNENFPGKDSSKFRYLELDNYSKPFEIFVGKSGGDFKPAFENIDNLKQGDSITVYFDETNKTKNSLVNNLAYFIDRDHETIFIKGNAIKYFIYGLVGFCIIFIIILFVLKQTGKIS